MPAGKFFYHHRNTKPSIIISSLFLVCCSFGDGESIGSSSLLSPAAAEEKANPGPAREEFVWVYKYDGGLQCGMGQVISLEEMKKQFVDIRVYDQGKKSDGLMRIALCGSPTGQANRYQIHREDLDKAKQKGFELWTFD
jgi:hypothetical protein